MVSVLLYPFPCASFPHIDLQWATFFDLPQGFEIHSLIHYTCTFNYRALPYSCLYEIHTYFFVYLFNVGKGK